MKIISVIFYDLIKFLTEVGGFYGAISSIFGLFSIYFMSKCFKKELLLFFNNQDKEIINEREIKKKMK